MNSSMYKVQPKQQESMRLHQKMEEIRAQSSVSSQDIATAASLLFDATHRNSFWLLIKTLRQATDDGILPYVKESEVEGMLKSNADLQPYFLPWQELDKEIMTVWSKTDGPFRFLANNIRNKEEILRLYSRYLHLQKSDAVEFQRYKEPIIISVLDAYKMSREVLKEVIFAIAPLSSGSTLD